MCVCVCVLRRPPSVAEYSSCRLRPHLVLSRTWIFKSVVLSTPTEEEEEETSDTRGNYSVRALKWYTQFCPLRSDGRPEWRPLVWCQLCRSKKNQHVYRRKRDSHFSATGSSGTPTYGFTAKSGKMAFSKLVICVVWGSEATALRW